MIALHRRNTKITAAVLILVTMILIIVMLPGTKASSETNERATFSVLSESNLRTGDQVPDRTAATAGMLQQAKVVDGPITRFGRGETELGEVVVAQMGSDICVFSLTGGPGNCGPIEGAGNGEIFAAQPVGCGKYEVTGIVPDGVSELIVKSGSEQNREGSVAVNSNAYTAELDSSQTTLTSPDGSISVELPLGSYAQDNDACSKR